MDNKKKVNVKGKSKTSNKSNNNKSVKKTTVVNKTKTPTTAKVTGSNKAKVATTNKDNVNNNLKDTKKANVKGKSNTKKVYSTKISKEEWLVIGIFTLVVLLISWVVMGTFPTLVMFVGLLLIYGIARLFTLTRGKKVARRTMNIVIILGLTICLCGCIGVGAFIGHVVKSAPDFNTTLLDTKESSIMYDMNGTEIARLGYELRDKVKYEDLPEIFVDALIATEDSRFFQHNGLDAPRFIKATIGQLMGNTNAGGASTLSMQVIKNTYTSYASRGMEGIIRKFTDVYLSMFKLEKQYTKEDIIGFYVNNHCLSGTVCGVQEAARTFFNKDIQDVTIVEAAVLAGMFQAPTSLNPYSRPENNRERTAEVIYYMHLHGYITEEEYNITMDIIDYKTVDIATLTEEEKKEHYGDGITALLSNGSSNTFEFQAYIDTVLEEFEEKYPDLDPYSMPLLIYTNLDPTKQTGINKIMSGETFDWNYRGDLSFVQSGIAVTEVSTGKLVAVGASRNRTGARTLNYATSISKQIGSTAKPIFDYGPGVEYLNWSTYEQFIDEPWNYTNGPAINNSDGLFKGQISLRQSLTESRNIPALKAFQANSKDNINTFITNLGLQAENGYLHEAHALGSFNGSNPKELSGAYAAFANGGTYIEPYTINKIVNRENGDTITANPKKVTAMSDATAYMVTDVLTDAAKYGLGVTFETLNTQVAAKTGTTNYSPEIIEKYSLKSGSIPDAWVAGYNPEYSIAFWLGVDRLDTLAAGQSMTYIQSGNVRTRLFKAVGDVVFSKSGNKFTQPASVVEVPVEVGSNPALRPSENTPIDQITYELFKAGTEPTEVSTKYIRLNDVTNLKATYDKEKKEVKLTWNKVATPASQNNYGRFGYQIYFNGIYLDFVDTNEYTLPTEYPNGTYLVVTSFENFTDNKSLGTAVTLKVEEEPKEDPKEDEEDDENTDTSTDKYSMTLKGNKYTTLTIDETFIDEKVIIIEKETDKDITKDLITAGALEITVKDKDGKKVDKIDTSKEGTYTIEYYLNYNGYNKTLTRTVAIK